MSDVYVPIYKRWKADTRSDEELFHIILTSDRNDEHDEAVFVLRFRSTRKIYEFAVSLCNSKKADERWEGVNILGMFGDPKPNPYYEETISLLLSMVNIEKRITVLHILLWAFEQMHDDRTLDTVLQFKHHSNKRLRKRVAITLGTFAHHNEQALRALIKLCSDQDRDVRDWATFELGSMYNPEVDIDIPEAHDALWQCAKEDDIEIRQQALRGLVFRGEKGLTGSLIKELSLDEIYDDVLEAAEFLADPNLLPYLLPIRKWEDMRDIDLLEDAIAACSEKNDDLEPITPNME